MDNLLVLFVVIFSGWIYYQSSISRNRILNRNAFFMKISFLIVSFILAFAEKDFIIVGQLAFGGRTPVVILIVIEIVDAFIDQRMKNK